MNKTIIRTIQLYCKPNKIVAKQLNRILFGCNFAYNQLLKNKVERDKEEVKQLTLSGQSKFLTKLRKENECLQIINRQILNEVVMRVNKTWNNHLRFKKLGLAKSYPKIKQLYRYRSFTYPFGDRGWWIENNRLFLPQNKEQGKRSSKKLAIKMVLHQEIKGIIQNLTIKEKNGKWYILFASEMEAERRIPTNKYVGMDLNLKKDAFCVLSDGTRFNHPLTHKKNERKLVELQQSLSKKQRGSKSRVKAKLLYSKQWEKVKNQQRDTFFKMANDFNEYDGIARENLKITNMIKNRSLSKAIFRASWANFTSILAHRVEDTGGQVVKVSPYNTTQRCSDCKELAKEKLTLKDRVFECFSCRFELDRDINSARNILDKAIETIGSGRTFEEIAVLLLG